MYIRHPEASKIQVEGKHILVRWFIFWNRPSSKVIYKVSKNFHFSVEKIEYMSENVSEIKFR